MDPSSVAASSISYNTATTMQAAGVSILSKSMDMQENQANKLIETMQSMPSFGHKLDVRV